MLWLEGIWRGAVRSVGLQLQQTRGVCVGGHERRRAWTEGQQWVGGVRRGAGLVLGHGAGGRCLCGKVCGGQDAEVAKGRGGG